ncbi:MAG: energy-coupling factor transporter transmembrane protein EcfT [Coriobacteriales bacterium]|jgi:energy-coupling factor transporter transmembrane protein EcfT
MGRASSLGGLSPYVEGSSALHRLDARAKVVLLAVATAAAFHIESLWALAACCAVAVLATARLRVRGASLARSLLPLAVGLLMIWLAYAVRLDGSGDVAGVGSAGLSSAGMLQGAVTVSRFLLLALLALIVGVTTPVEAVSAALVSILRPLGALRVPVDDLATLLTLALRFIPMCAEQLDRVVDAQRARGAAMSSGSFARRIMAWVPVFIPLFVGVFRRCEALADAMQARCYRGRGRTHLAQPALSRRDVAATVAGCVLLVAMAAAL